MSVRRKPPVLDVVTLARPAAPRASGERIADRYELVDHYGSGPLGHTYRARADGGHSVALKILAHELVPTSAERTALLTDLSKLRDREMPCIAVPIDFGIDSGVAYVVSHWVAGKSLRRVLGAYRDAGRGIPPVEAYGVLEGVVRALRQLHTVCAHGAIYPENIQISRDGRVILTDAGIAGAVPHARFVEHLERFPDVFGYIAPEIRAGKSPSAGADLFALGALASELLAGDPAAATAGIAGAMIENATPEIEEALRGLTSMKASRRAGALPKLLESLSKLVGRRSLPITSALPRQVARTEVHPVAGADVPRSRRAARRT